MELEQNNDLENLYHSITGEIICTFHTKLPQRFHIQQQKITVSTDMDQNSLELLLKNLLNQNIPEEKLNAIHFEFLIQQQLLRGNIKSHMIRNNISSENILDIYYFIALNKPQEKSKNNQEDWISCIDKIMGLDKNHYVVSLYNGTVSFYSQENIKVHTHKIQEDPIKVIKTFPGSLQNTNYLITGGLEDIRINMVTSQSNKYQVRQVAQCQNSGDIIFGLDNSPELNHLFCSVGSGKQLTVWRIPEDLQSLKSIKKKSKKIQLNIPKIKFEHNEEIHQGSINSVLWYESNRIYTGSSDHTIRITDVETFNEISTFTVRDSITTSLDSKHENILSSHEDGYIRLWDKRTTNKPQKSFKSHTKFVSCAKFSASSSFIFGSCSYDHTVKLWDIRSKFPLQTLDTHHDKVFALFWKDKKQLVTGGSDSLVAVHSFQNNP